MTKMPQTVGEMFPSQWLKATDLSQPVTVKIVAVDVREFRQADGSQEWRPVLTFERASKRLIANKTQCAALAQLTGSERFADWPGKTVRLEPARAQNGRLTIHISQPAAPVKTGDPD